MQNFEYMMQEIMLKISQNSFNTHPRFYFIFELTHGLLIPYTNNK